ncbi:MAG TPA: biliverdin-producing heme oxygenase [Steroidobacteraceae bacterium]
MSAIAQLRSATSSSHQRLEKRLDVKARFTDLSAYRAHLEKMWGFCAALEARLAPQSFGGALPDYEARRKLPLLTHDLVDLGEAAGGVASLPRCAALPQEMDAAAAFGCVYVLEGATLGGRTLLPLVHSRLGFTPSHGARYLASYGDNVAAMWRDFGAALDSWCCVAQRRYTAMQAAVATFELLAEWLCEAP